MSIKSILVWPQEVCCSSKADNSSEDTHHSEYAAKCICETLIYEGLGCMGEHYPIEARVEVDGEIKFKWTAANGYELDVTKKEKPLYWVGSLV